MNLANNDKPIGVLKIKAYGKKFKVTFSNDELLVLSMEQLVSNRISLDKRFTESEFKKITKEAKLSLWLDKAINHATYKQRTKQEMFLYLKQKSDLELDEVNIVLKKLTQLGLIDDVLYAKNFKEDCLNKGRGIKYFQNHLRLLGVDNAIINEVSLSFSENKILEELINIYQKEANRLTCYPKKIQIQKLMVKMSRKGLTTSTINEVIANINFREDFEDSFNKDLSKIKNKTDDKQKWIAYLLQKGYPYDYIRSHLK